MQEKGNGRVMHIDMRCSALPSSSSREKNSQPKALHRESDTRTSVWPYRTSRRWMFSFSFWSKMTSRCPSWASASAMRRALSCSSSSDALPGPGGRPLLCSISSSFLMDSSLAPSVCFWVSILSSISSRVFLSRKSSLACLSCSACNRRKFSSVSSMVVKCSEAERLPLSCCSRWFRSRCVRSSSCRAWMVIWRCWWPSDTHKTHSYWKTLDTEQTSVMWCKQYCGDRRIANILETYLTEIRDLTWSLHATVWLIWGKIEIFFFFILEQ